ncbi:MAG TPA: ATP-binding protein [Nitrososphaeraceae archaeon]|nr:ATP-binding protein [Nitrososphaeraceae archaeon]
MSGDEPLGEEVDSRLHKLVSKITEKEAVESTNIKIIQNPRESIKLAYDIVKSAKEEVLRIFPSINAFRRQTRIGIMHLFKEAVEQGVKVRILITGDEQQIIQITNEVSLALPQIDIRAIDKSLHTRIGIVVVDRKESLIIESKDDTKDNSYDASGLAAYSNSKPIALSYASIFESLWKQAELYEQLKVHNKMQKEFINIAAHELRTPIQPILGLSELLRSKISDNNDEQKELLDTIIRNAKRLKRLADDILDVTKIESQSLQLKKERFNITQMILNALADYRRRNDTNKEEEKEKIKVVVAFKEDIFVEADRDRLNQVICNLISNAFKFTEEEGIVSITAEKKDNQILISIKDSGAGIDQEILPILFSKFASKSFSGTGLGLFISRNIIEAHGGKIWAENNLDGKGARFSFSLPLKIMLE